MDERGFENHHLLSFQMLTYYSGKEPNTHSSQAKRDFIYLYVSFVCCHDHIVGSQWLMSLRSKIVINVTRSKKHKKSSATKKNKHSQPKSSHSSKPLWDNSILTSFQNTLGVAVNLVSGGKLLYGTLTISVKHCSWALSLPLSTYDIIIIIITTIISCMGTVWG